MVAQSTVRTYEVNHEFRCVEGILLLRQRGQIRFLFSRKKNLFFFMRAQHVLSYHIIYVPMTEQEINQALAMVRYLRYRCASRHLICLRQFIRPRTVTNLNLGPPKVWFWQSTILGPPLWKRPYNIYGKFSYTYGTKH